MEDQIVDTERDDREKAPSPVLGNDKFTRKYLLSRRMQRKSRVKLTTRFCEDDVRQATTSASDNSPILTPENYEVGQTKKMKREYETQESMKKDLVLEKPDVSTKNMFDAQCKIVHLNDNVIKDQFIKGKHEISVNKPCLDTDVKPESALACINKNFDLQSLNRNDSVGFTTASGKDIQLQISNEVIKNSASLFDDILHPEKSFQNSRSNKYAFLSKTKSQQEKENISDNIVINTGVLNFCGFKTASGGNVHLTESAYKAACKKFDNEFGDSKYSVSGTNEEMASCFTQETNELFSNLTILENQCLTEIDKCYNSEVFKGFDEDSVLQSKKYFDKFMEIVSKFCKSKSVYQKRKRTRSTHLKAKNVTDQFKGFHNESIEESKKKVEKFLLLYEKFTELDDTLCPNNALDETIKPDASNTGFNSASENNLTVSEPSLKILNLFKTTGDFNSNFSQCDTESISPRPGFQTAGGNPVKLSENALKKAKQLFQDVDFTNSDKESSLATDFVRPFATTLEKTKSQCNIDGNIPIPGFQTARGTTLKISEDALKRAQHLFQSCDQDFDNRISFNQNDSDNVNSESGFRTAGGSSLKLSEEALRKAQHLFQGCGQDFDNRIDFNQNDSENVNFKSGFQTAGGSSLKLSEEALRKAKHMYQNIENDSFNQNISEKVNVQSGFQTAQGNSLKISEGALKKAERLYQDVDNESPSAKLAISTTSVVEENVSFDHSKNSSKNFRRKKRLGSSFCKQIPISKQKIEQAMKLFEDEKLDIMSPVRTNLPTVYNSTPLKNVSFTTICPEITPIKSVNNSSVQETYVKDYIDDRFIIKDYTKGTIESWTGALDNERKCLERKLAMIVERQKALNLQKHRTENISQDNEKRRNGVLFDKKQNSARILLEHYLKIDSSTRKRFDITPQNAEFLHFNYTEQYLPYIATLDGACLIPNIDNYIGLSEVEVAFKIIPGVDPKLIPIGWIKNHFKWIVWKLASYENFATNMADSLSLENVIQQLKYRYDREIDRAERSTLRKIFELDDTPQKRMVLCVSNIFKLENQTYELELTDGWYSIRTAIDEPLCKQVSTRKIQLGTKIMTCGAEIVNCEGHHPLQAPDMVRLKINCNCTRRTRWYVKLGYQKCPEPFPVKLSSIHPNGGLIGRIKIFIARVYPVKYMEKQNKLTIWRNKKAEELRAQEWENKGRQDIERLKETISRDYEMGIKNKLSVNPNISTDEIQKINCPETLFTLYQTNKDPEKLEEILSSSQKLSIMNYQQKQMFLKQQDISRKLEDSVSKMQIPKRDVTPVLQLIVIDMLDLNAKNCIFQIWRPTESHFEIMKESSVFNVYNVLTKKNGDLYTGKRTRFEIDHTESLTLSKYKRVLLSISQICELETKPLFNEYDTVGIVITFSISFCTQSLWLADSSERLLFIKIFESPKNCLLLDKLKTGQVIAISNLLYSKSSQEFGEGIANQLTVISCYPQAKHLQEGINLLNEELPKDLSVFVERCKQKISFFTEKINITKDCKNVSSRSLIQSNSLGTYDVFDESSDVLFSMIDVDKYK